MDDTHPIPSTERELPSSEERNMALFAHLGIFTSVVVGPLSFLVPLLVHQYWKDRSEFVATEAKEALNFQLTLLLLSLAGVILLVVFIGIGVLLMLAVMGVVLPVLAAIRVGEGSSYRYPLTIGIVQ